MEDIIEVKETSGVPSTLADDGLLAIARAAEGRIEAVNTIKRLALRVTNSRDWVDIGGNPYMQASACQKVGRLFGVSWRVGEATLVNEEGGNFRFEYLGEFTLGNVTVDAVGVRSSKDDFFSVKKGPWDNDAKAYTKIRVPPSEIDRGDVKKAAFTNCLNNGVKSLLGLKNLSWDDLKEGGIKREEMAGFNFKGNKPTTDDIKSEGAMEWAGKVKDVRKKSGEKNGKTWTSYTVISEDDKEYKTFSESFAKLAADAKTNSTGVKITFKTGQYGNDIETLVAVQREPGEEG